MATAASTGPDSQTTLEDGRLIRIVVVAMTRLGSVAIRVEGHISERHEILVWAMPCSLSLNQSFHFDTALTRAIFILNNYHEEIAVLQMSNDVVAFLLLLSVVAPRFNNRRVGIQPFGYIERVNP